MIQWAAEYQGAPFDALLCDPPYEIGLLDRTWDMTGVAFRAETWDALSRHLRDGAYGMVFASARGAHRLACAIEDAGLLVHPQVLDWVTSQGFPKGQRVDILWDRALRKKTNPEFNAVRDWLRRKVKEKGLTYKAIDTALGNPNSQPMIPTQEAWAVIKELLGVEEDIERPAQFAAYEKLVVGKQRKARSSGSSFALPTTGDSLEYKEWDMIAAQDERAARWYGYRYGQQALKPAVEPVVLFQKPGAWNDLVIPYPACYCPKAAKSERNAGLDRYNPHPSVKPIALARYLAGLLASAGPAKRLLVPFAGVESECIGAMQAGWDEIVGVERESEYIPIAEQRSKFWSGVMAQAATGAKKDGRGQLGLF